MKANDDGDGDEIINLIIVGTAGQGVITLKRLIEQVAAENGYEGIFGSEMHGLAQREGAIASHCRIQRRISEDPRKNIQSPTVCYGDADLIIGLEPVEVLRNGGLFISEKTSFVINSRDIPPIMVTAGKEKYPSVQEIISILLEFGADERRIYLMNATLLAIDEIKDPQKMNLVMLGFALITGILDFKKETCEKVIKKELRDPDLNIKAFRLGLTRGLEIITKKSTH
ncbi:MAG: 2-oxoacid:acceptor oxidoreductase family protein [Promethearchaeota archaeon]